MEIPIKLLDERARLPERARPHDAGYDLRCLEGFTLRPQEQTIVRTGLAIALPDGVAGLVLPRSGLAARHGITLVNSPGLIDPNYRGEIRVVMTNLGQDPFTAQPGERIAQLLLTPFLSPRWREAGELSPSPDDRGGAGFGSSGRA